MRGTRRWIKRGENGFWRMIKRRRRGRGRGCGCVERKEAQGGSESVNNVNPEEDEGQSHRIKQAPV